MVFSGGRGGWRCGMGTGPHQGVQGSFLVVLGRSHVVMTTEPSMAVPMANTLLALILSL